MNQIFNTLPKSIDAYLIRSEPFPIRITAGSEQDFNYSRGSCAPPWEIRISLALVKPFGHVPHLIRAILRSFRIFYFSTDLLIYFSYSSYNPSVLLLPFLQASYIIFQGLFRLPNWPVRQFCATGGNGMYRYCIALAIYSDSLVTMGTASGPGVRGTSFRVSHNQLKQSINPLSYSCHLSFFSDCTQGPQIMLLVRLVSQFNLWQGDSRLSESSICRSLVLVKPCLRLSPLIVPTLLPFIFHITL